jgi:hypothetical protein
MNFCVHENDMVTIRFSKNKFYDVMAPFFVHDVVALNIYPLHHILLELSILVK